MKPLTLITAAIVAISGALIAAVPILAVVAAANGAAGGATAAAVICERLVDATDRILHDAEAVATASATPTSQGGVYGIRTDTWTSLDVNGDAATPTEASPERQHEIALQLAEQLLSTHGTDDRAIATTWLTGSPDGTSVEPRAWATPLVDLLRQWQAADDAWPARPIENCASDTTIDVGGSAPDGDLALPLPRTALTRSALTQPHHDYPAIDLLAPVGTPVDAVASGAVITVHHWPHNWWQYGCTTRDQPLGCATCGNGITILDTTGHRWTYCHMQATWPLLGANVRPGEQIGTVGNTGRSGTPHLHLEIRDPSGAQHCPQALLQAIWDDRPFTLTDVAHLPMSGCSFG